MNIIEPIVNEEIAKSLGILPEELSKIREILGRNPNYTELSIFSVMWSEHCSYKNSITYLKKLPRKGKPKRKSLNQDAHEKGFQK